MEATAHTEDAWPPRMRSQVPSTRFQMLTMRSVLPLTTRPTPRVSRAQTVPLTLPLPLFITLSQLVPVAPHRRSVPSPLPLTMRPSGRAARAYTVLV